jgi:hypothetical protein
MIPGDFIKKLEWTAIVRLALSPVQFSLTGRLQSLALCSMNQIEGLSEPLSRNLARLPYQALCIPVVVDCLRIQVWLRFRSSSLRPIEWALERAKSWSLKKHYLVVLIVRLDWRNTYFKSTLRSSSSHFLYPSSSLRLSFSLPEPGNLLCSAFSSA